MRTATPISAAEPVAGSSRAMEQSGGYRTSAGSMSYSAEEMQLAIDLDIAPSPTEKSRDSAWPPKRKRDVAESQTSVAGPLPKRTMGNSRQAITRQPLALPATAPLSSTAAGASSQANHKRSGFVKRSTAVPAPSIGTSQRDVRKSQLDQHDTLMDQSPSGPRSPSRVPRRNLFGQGTS